MLTEPRDRTARGDVAGFGPSVGAVAEYSGRPLQLFEDETAAVKWLLKQAEE